ncbi:hypothetical protein ACLMJK_006020 [Lecanora helva]
MPTDDAASSLNARISENIPPGPAQRLSRSPHPYHRQRRSLLQDGSNSTYTSPAPVITSANLVQEPNHAAQEPTYFDADHRKRRKQPQSPSDSGTEADDERGEILLGLPAPPNRLRKGLKGDNNAGTASPLLTPSYLDQEPRRLVLKAQSKRRASLQSQSCTDEETQKLREKFVRRRQAELVRRASETALIGFVGYVACNSNIVWLLHRSQSVSSSALELEPGCKTTLLALFSHATTVVTLYAIYPLRIIYKNNAISVAKHRSRFYIHIPAAFEPAPLLYPVLVPVFIAVSLFHANKEFLLPNLILSIASIPSKILPFNKGVPWCNPTQWLLSTVPFLVTRSVHQRNGLAYLPTDGFRELSSARDEVMLLLYPLHQALLPVLGYLTTTSLLPAELQLLSIAMVNLYLHAKAPQTVILQCLLWTGGLLMFVLCGKVLSWGVSLARIPSWRFRKRHAKMRQRSTLLTAIDDYLHGRLSRWGAFSRNSSDSDDSEDDDPKKLTISGQRRHRQLLSVDTRLGGSITNANIAQLPETAPFTAGEDLKLVRTGLNDSVEPFQRESGHKRERRSTLPSYIRAAPADFTKEPLRRSKTTLSKAPKSWSLRSFTEAQAIVIKWTLALYVYAATAAIIFLAVKKYVSSKALYDQEPVGWALGYLFGDIPFFQNWVKRANLEHWICLPTYDSSFHGQMTYDFVSLSNYLGAANIRLLVCVYCILIILLGLLAVFRLSAVAEVDTRRKVFHGMMVAMFLPTIFVDPAFVSLAFILILTVFLLLDLFRASQLPPLSRPLTHFLAPYVDGRDHRGPVIVSHIFLLIGCAIPLWLSLAAVSRTGNWPWKGWDVERRDMSMISGVVCVGLGDAAASLIGRRYGRRRWCWSGGKSLEGSFAFAMAVLLGLTFARVWLVLGGWDCDNRDSWALTLGKALIAATGASLTEAVLTGGNDNVIVPIILWLLVRGLKI